MRFLAALGLLFFLAAGSRALAQVAVGAQMERSQFLLYERVDLLVTLTNASETDLALDNDGNHPWLSFMVYNHDHLPVRPERQALFKPLTLKQGETKTLRINLTPLFSFRTEGSYTAQAVVNLPGSGDLVSQEVPFSVQRGREVWTVTRSIDGSNRIYSLLRFSPKPNETDLYLRVEDPSENVVFANVGLGPVEAYIDPQVFFDPAGNIHVLQLIAMSTYLYTRADAQGKVMHQGVFKTFQEIRPRLAQMDDGNVYVQGGLEETPQSAHETLSSGQRGTLTSDQRPQAPATGDFSAAPPDATSPVALPGQTPTPGARPQVDSR